MGYIYQRKGGLSYIWYNEEVSLKIIDSTQVHYTSNAGLAESSLQLKSPIQLDKECMHDQQEARR